MKEIYFTTSTIFIPISIMGFTNSIFGIQPLTYISTSHRELFENGWPDKNMGATY
jgi:ABC-type polysaccharide/polyol phosphate export permease